MEAQPQMQVRVAVPDEEPAIHASGRKSLLNLLNPGPDCLDQQAVHVRRAGIDLGIEPLGTRQKTPEMPRNCASCQRLGHWKSGFVRGWMPGFGLGLSVQ